MDRAVINTAFVSGRLGQAIYRQDEELYAIGPYGGPRPASASELHEITSLGAEYQLVRDRTAEAIQDELRRLVINYNALFLVISLLDLELSLSTRIVAAKSAEGVLMDDSARQFVSRRILSVPVPVRTRASRHEIVSP